METIAPRGRFTGPILPRFILEMEMSTDAKMLYAILCDFAGDKDHCWPSQARLAGMLSCSVSSVKKSLRELAARDLISIRRSGYHASTYYILRPKNVALFSRPRESKIACPQAKIGYEKNFKKKETTYPPTPTQQNAKEPPSISDPRCGRGDFFSANGAFESFWAMYPKKEAKELARSVWHRLWRRGVIRVAALVEALRRFVATDSWQREHGRYVPQLVNWLRGQRWLDEAPENSGESCPAEKDKHEEARRLNELFAEQEKRRNVRYQAETAQLRPVFEAFLARFVDGETMRGPAWGLWAMLRRKGIAPSAADVPNTDTTDSPLAFLNQWRMAHV